MHEIRQKIGEQELRNDGSTSACNIRKESAFLELISSQSQKLVALDREVRQIPIEPERTQPANDHGTSAALILSMELENACMKHKLRVLERQLDDEHQIRAMREKEIETLRDHEQVFRERVGELTRLLDKKTKELDAYKQMMRERESEDREKWAKVVEEKDQMRVLNSRLLKDIAGLEAERDWQRARIKRFNESAASLRVQRDSARNILKILEKQQQLKEGTQDATGHMEPKIKNENGTTPEAGSLDEWATVKEEPEEVQFLWGEKPNGVSDKATAASTTTSLNTSRKRSHDYHTAPEERNEDTTLHRDVNDSTAKRHRVSNDLFEPPLNVRVNFIRSKAPSPVEVDNDSSTAESAVTVCEEANTEPK